MGRCCQIIVFVLALVLLAGCGGKNPHTHRGKKYQPTKTAIPSFQPQKIPVSCNVFAHLLVWLPENSSGKTIAQWVETEAQLLGANRLLIGGSRQAEDDEGLQFVYYGPEREYNSRERWFGWKFGHEEWTEQGEWVTLGYKEWGNADISFNYPIVMQAAFLRCQ